jgi:peptidoglycan hydrolase CwlO-like protein
MLNLTTLSQDAAKFTDSRLTNESQYILSKIYELDDLSHELQKRINEVNNEMQALQEYSEILSNEMERRGW